MIPAFFLKEARLVSPCFFYICRFFEASGAPLFRALGLGV